MRHEHEGAARESRRDRYDAAARAAQPARLARCTGYNPDSDRHREARMKVDAALRRAIAAMGGEARAALYRRDQSEAKQPHPPATRPTAGRKPAAFTPRAGAERARSATRPPPAAPKPPISTVALTPQQKAAARAAASRPARRAAQRARERAAKERKP